MHVIKARNVEDALLRGLSLLQQYGVRRDSRNGPVVMMDEPVTTQYARPRERVLFNPLRDANPFFHLVEALWMLCGCETVDVPAYFVKRMQDYSDDGRIFNAPYGARWRWHFGRDQLEVVARRLREQPDDRRSVLQIWDQAKDLDTKTKDTACNLVVHFQRDGDGALDMTVFCRSNDIVWGAYGANGVHFSMLQEFVAAWIGCPVGRYWQISSNYHAYVDVFKKLLPVLAEDDAWSRPLWYDRLNMVPKPLVSTPMHIWEQDLHRFLSELAQLIRGMRSRFELEPNYQDPFFIHVAHPMVAAYAAHKQQRKDEALAHTGRMRANDWALACTMWLERRYDRKGRPPLNDDGGKFTRET
jgi:thymidylate synthase